MHKLSVHKTGLSLGFFLAFIYLVWVVLVATGLASQLLNWKLGLLFLNNPFSVGAFSLAASIELIIITFIGGYIWGAIFAGIWNWAHK